MFSMQRVETISNASNTQIISANSTSPNRSLFLPHPGLRFCSVFVIMLEKTTVDKIHIIKKCSCLYSLIVRRCALIILDLRGPQSKF